MSKPRLSGPRRTEAKNRSTDDSPGQDEIGDGRNGRLLRQHRRGSQDQESEIPEDLDAREWSGSRCPEAGTRNPDAGAQTAGEKGGEEGEGHQSGKPPDRRHGDEACGDGELDDGDDPGHRIGCRNAEKVELVGGRSDVAEFRDRGNEKGGGEEERCEVSDAC